MPYAWNMATETSSTGRDSDKFMLRLPEGMRARLKECAQTNSRTLNAEVVARLQTSFGTEDPATPPLPVKTVVSLRWGSEGQLVNVVLPDEYVDEFVRPAVADLIRAGLDRWTAERPFECFEKRAKTELQLVVKKPA
ncbi:MAG: Arc family DNA-binding protein [Proteobacteria bacterium]|nr:MAG: Arc family DNA-binding protein [Pseudomonadota bacterium]